MIRSIAYQIAQRIPAFAAALDKVVPAVFANGTQLSAVDLWQQLLVDPLHSINDEIAADRTSVGRKYVILIDALDEAGATGTTGGASELLDLIASCLAALPQWIGLLVTSRPEDAIVRKLKKYQPMELTCERSVRRAGKHAAFTSRVAVAHLFESCLSLQCREPARCSRVHSSLHLIRRGFDETRCCCGFIAEEERRSDSLRSTYVTVAWSLLR